MYRKIRKKREHFISLKIREIKLHSADQKEEEKVQSYPVQKTKQSDIFCV